MHLLHRPAPPWALIDHGVRYRPKTVPSSCHAYVSLTCQCSMSGLPAKEVVEWASDCRGQRNCLNGVYGSRLDTRDVYMSAYLRGWHGTRRGALGSRKLSFRVVASSDMKWSGVACAALAVDDDRLRLAHLHAVECSGGDLEEMRWQAACLGEGGREREGGRGRERGRGREGGAR